MNKFFMRFLISFYDEFLSEIPSRRLYLPNCETNKKQSRYIGAKREALACKYYFHASSKRAGEREEKTL